MDDALKEVDDKRSLRAPTRDRSRSRLSKNCSRASSRRASREPTSAGTRRSCSRSHGRKLRERGQALKQLQERLRLVEMELLAACDAEQRRRRSERRSPHDVARRWDHQSRSRPPAARGSRPRESLSCSRLPNARAPRESARAGVRHHHSNRSKESERN